MPKSRTRTKRKERVITNKDKANIVSAYQKKCDEYFNKPVEELITLQKSRKVKGTYLKALNYIIGYKMSEKSYGPITPIN